MLNGYISEHDYLEGIVADNTDPENWGRVRVHIVGKTEGLETDKLPFARVLQPLTSSLNISDPVPAVGTTVLILKTNSDYNSLIILGRFKKVSQIP